MTAPRAPDHGRVRGDTVSESNDPPASRTRTTGHRFSSLALHRRQMGQVQRVGAVVALARRAATLAILALPVRLVVLGLTSVAIPKLAGHRWRPSSGAT